MVLPSSLRSVDRVAEVVFTVFVGFYVGPFEFGGAASGSWEG